MIGLNLACRGDEILRLEDRAKAPANGQKRSELIDQIVSIVNTEIIDAGRLSYGLRALYGLGVPKERLIEMAEHYNDRMRFVAHQLSPHPTQIPHIHFFYVQEDGGYEKIEVNNAGHPS